MRTPPRAVTTETDSRVCSRDAGSPASRVNSAMAPDVPRLQPASVSASWPARKSRMCSVVIIGGPVSTGARGLIHAISCKPNAAKDAEPRRQESGRILVVQIEEVIDPAEQLDLVAKRIISPQVHDGIARRHKAGHCAIAADIEPVADVKQCARQSERIDRRPRRR